MSSILEGIFKGFVQWVYSLCLEIVQYISNALLDVFNMDLEYFRQVAPVTDDILQIVTAVGWALLLGNLVFQAVKSMVTGLGFEGEDPKLLFTRTFVFAFLLLFSQQVCEIGLGISSQIISLLQIPSSVTVTIPEESNFNIGASWLLVIIVGFVIMWQFVKLFFEIAERYVVTAMLVLLAPLAFGMGGSKNTEDIFRGWARMFGSMCLMMILNVVFLKLLISAMGYIPSGVAVLPWMLLIVGIARVARKVDGIVARIGLNPAITGDGLGRGLPGMMAYAVIKGLGTSVAKAASNSAGKQQPHGGAAGRAPGGSHTPPPTTPPPGGGSTTNGGRVAGTQEKRGKYAPQQGGTQVSSASTETVTGQQAGTAPGQVEHISATPGQERPAAYQSPADGRNAVQEQQSSSHRQEMRRTSVPPEARGAAATRNSARFHPGIRILPLDTFTESTTGQQHDGQETPQKPPIGRVQAARTGGGDPNIGHTTRGRRGESRRSAVVHQFARCQETETATSSDAGVSRRQRSSLQADGTPKITTPPGVGRGTAATATPPSGEKRSPAASAHLIGGTHAPVETAGTRRPPGRVPSSGGTTPSAGIAGKREAPVGPQPVVGGGTPAAGTAGISPSPTHESPPTAATRSAGTAGMRRPPPSSHPIVDGRSASVGAAGMQTPSRHTRSAPAEAAASAGKAGTAPKPTRPPINQGTRRIKQDLGRPPVSRKTNNSRQTRRKRGDAHES